MFGGKHVFYWNIKDIASVALSAVGIVGSLWIMNKSLKTADELAADTAKKEASLTGKIKRKVTMEIEKRFDL